MKQLQLYKEAASAVSSSYISCMKQLHQLHEAAAQQCHKAAATA